jgi:hypothetical protein
VVAEYDAHNVVLKNRQMAAADFSIDIYVLFRVPAQNLIICSTVKMYSRLSAIATPTFLVSVILNDRMGVKHLDSLH